MRYQLSVLTFCLIFLPYLITALQFDVTNNTTNAPTNKTTTTFNPLPTCGTYCLCECDSTSCKLLSCEIPDGVTEIDLSYTNLVSISDGAFTTKNADKITSLNFAHNKFTQLSLPTGVFAPLPILKYLHLEAAFSGTYKIPTVLFYPLKNLQFLYLNSNPEIKFESGDVFVANTLMCNLYLSRSSISYLPAGLFRTMKAMHSLQLDHNNIVVLTEDLLPADNPNGHIYLHLANNPLQTMPNSTVSGYGGFPEMAVKVYLMNVPLYCDCSSAWMTADNTYNAVCSEPSQYAGFAPYDVHFEPCQ